MIRRHGLGPRAPLVQRCLFHNAQEFLFVDLAVAIAVGFVDHLLRRSKTATVETRYVTMCDALLVALPRLDFRPVLSPLA